jgi:hypothetical protein
MRASAEQWEKGSRDPDEDEQRLLPTSHASGW